MPLVANYWSRNTAKIKFIGQRVGGMDKLKGLKIANVYHDSPYGRETLPILEKQAEIYGCESATMSRSRVFRFRR